jgi:hypothetical protein
MWQIRVASGMHVRVCIPGKACRGIREIKIEEKRLYVFWGEGDGEGEGKRGEERGREGKRGEEGEATRRKMCLGRANARGWERRVEIYTGSFATTAPSAFVEVTTVSIS